MHYLTIIYAPFRCCGEGINFRLLYYTVNNVNKSIFFVFSLQFNMYTAFNYIIYTIYSSYKYDCQLVLDEVLHSEGSEVDLAQALA